MHNPIRTVRFALALKNFVGPNGYNANLCAKETVDAVEYATAAFAAAIVFAILGISFYFVLATIGVVFTILAIWKTILTHYFLKEGGYMKRVDFPTIRA